uniref:Uncharacterized protein n=1 Tax=Zooxanthella nutricula TaxID=1333877 RepID=A0A6U9EEZ0_9DINO
MARLDDFPRLNSRSSSGSSSRSSTVPPGMYKDTFGRKQHEHQVKYMRSSSRNPWVASPALCEFPASVARHADKWDQAHPALTRPVNKRSYYSPSFWVKTVEDGNAARSATYLDYQFTADYSAIWRERLKKEEKLSRRKDAAEDADDGGVVPRAPPRPASGKVPFSHLARSHSSFGAASSTVWKP